MKKLDTGSCRRTGETTFYETIIDKMFSIEEGEMEHLSKRILVVDDDQGILDSFEVLLGDRYDLVMTDNGYEALRIIETKPPRLVFLDIKMPGLDGMDVLKRLRKDQKKVEVVIITATHREETEKEAKSLGAIDFLMKPLNIVEVERIASQILS